MKTIHSMRSADMQIYRCPDCSGALAAKGVDAPAMAFIEDGALECGRCGREYDVRNGIPRFMASDNYCRSFGFQWDRHRRTQIDKFNGTTLSRDRFFTTTGWPRELAGKRILEAGCGAGRFTQVALDAGADVWSFDYSDSVDANLANNGHSERFHLFQADIYNIPLKHEFFDKAFCMGVLQHCPDVKRAFMSLLPFLKPGGELVVDCYDKDQRNPATTSLYWLRRFTPRMNLRTLYGLIKASYPMLLFMQRMLNRKTAWGIRRRIPLFRRLPVSLVPIMDYSELYRGKMSRKMIREWSVLDTFDVLSPAHDQPQTLDEIAKWFHEAGLDAIEVRRGGNGIVGKGIKRGSSAQYVGN